MNNYSWIEKKLHLLALSSNFMREIMFDTERLIFSDIKKDNLQNHVYISGLARSGTTILLNSIYLSGEFASLTYDDMPFILSPNLWSKLHIKDKNPELKERAHGDNVQISINSPEAFEEVFWKTFTNSSERDKLYKEYISLILKKYKKTRYLSKNNQNLKRLIRINKIYPNAKILIPFRDPLQHSNSILYQHMRFLSEKENHPFTIQYMRLIGHSEFGPDYKAFSSSGMQFKDDTSLNHWLEQWVIVYEKVLRLPFESENFYPVCYELLSNDNNFWPHIKKLLQIEHNFSRDDFKESKKEIVKNFDLNLLDKAMNLYEQLKKISSKKIYAMDAKNL